MRLSALSRAFIMTFMLVLVSSIVIQAQTTAFTYQGRLADAAISATNGFYDFEFALFDAVSTGNQIGSSVEKTGVAVNNGNFTVELDFGAGAFTGAERFLQVAVRKNSNESYVPLNPRQRITSVPYAIKAGNAELLNGQPASAYGSSSQVSALQALITTQQTQIQQLQTELAATTGGTHLWSKRFGSSASNESGRSIATDGSGNVFVVGNFTGTVDFGGGGLQSSGVEDIFVAKYSGATGAHIWSKRFGSVSTDIPYGVAVDSSGNVLITGFFNATVDFGGVPLQSLGSNDVFLVKLSGANGSHIWSKRFGGTGVDAANDIAVDSAGDVFITGYFNGNADFGGLVLKSASIEDIFVAKYSGGTGSHLWSQRFGGLGFDVGHGISTDNGGNLFITGYFNSETINFGGGDLSTAGSIDIYLAKLASANGSHLWSKRFGGSSDEYSERIVADSSGSVLITGFFNSPTINFGGGLSSNASFVGMSDIFVVKYNSSGVYQWSKIFGSLYSDVGFDIKVDRNDNAVITGNFGDTVNFGGASLNSAGDYDIFIAKYAGGSGAHIWSRRYGSDSLEAVFGLALDNAGNAFITGYFGSATLDFGGGVLRNAGSSPGYSASYDIFAAKLMK